MPVQFQSNSNLQCDKFSTDAEKETCLEQLEYNKKIENSIKIALSAVVGPVTFYYVNSESQKVDNGKNNIGNTLYCSK